MDIAFVTHNELGRRCLETLDELGANVTSVYTRPSAESLSGQVPLESLAKEVTAEYHRVESMNSDETVASLRQADPDLLFVVGWSELVEQRVIDIPETAPLGMHPAPLPRGRGRAPVAWNLIKGRDQTALTLFGLVEEADAGAIYGQRPIEIDIQDTAASLNEKIETAGPKLLNKCYPRIVDGSVDPTPQSDDDATWWPRRLPQHGLIDWNRSALDVHNWIRGQSHPYPGAFTYLNGEKITIWQSDPPQGEQVYAKPGEILAVNGDRLLVAAWEEAIPLRRVQVGDGEERPATELVTEGWFEIGDVFQNARDYLTADCRPGRHNSGRD